MEEEKRPSVRVGLLALCCLAGCSSSSTPAVPRTPGDAGGAAALACGTAGTFSGDGASGTYAVGTNPGDVCPGSSSAAATTTAPAAVTPFVPAAPAQTVLYVALHVTTAASTVRLDALGVTLPTALATYRSYELFDYGAPSAAAADAWRDTGLATTPFDAIVGFNGATANPGTDLQYASPFTTNRETVLAIVGTP